MKKIVEPKHFFTVCSALQAQVGTKTVIKIIDEKTIVKATWRFKPNGRNKREEMVVTLGAPDYRTQAFIKACKKAKEPFPIKKLVFRRYPVKKS